MDRLNTSAIEFIGGQKVQTIESEDRTLIIVEDVRNNDDVLRGFVSKTEEKDGELVYYLDNGYKVRLFPPPEDNSS